MDTIAYYAMMALLESGIRAFPITCEDIEQVLKSKGYQVKVFSLELSENIAILQKNDLWSVAQKYKGFTYTSENKKIVLVRDTVGKVEKRKILAHELGHIVLEHSAPPRYFRI